jgi:hypothetical protein
MITNDTNRFWHFKKTKIDAMREALGGEALQTRMGLESERGQCGVGNETSSEENGYVAIKTKSFGRALILN